MNSSPNQMMNEAWRSKGMTLVVNDGYLVQRRVVMSVRSTYGNGIQLDLNAPLVGCTSTLFDVKPSDHGRVSFEETHHEDHVHDWMEKPSGR